MQIPSTVWSPPKKDPWRKSTLSHTDWPTAATATITRDTPKPNKRIRKLLKNRTPRTKRIRSPTCFPRQVVLSKLQQTRKHRRRINWRGRTLRFFKLNRICQLMFIAIWLMILSQNNQVVNSNPSTSCNPRISELPPIQPPLRSPLPTLPQSRPGSSSSNLRTRT